jgi:diaminopimelate decarboxylase
MSFTYRMGVLHADDVAIPAIAEAVGTPFYCYSSTLIADRYRAFAAALADLEPTICYALKANGNQAVVRTLADLGAGADVVSEGELLRAIAAGVPPTRIVFSGVGKTKAEIRTALEHGIWQLNAESLPELDALSEVATATGRTAQIVLRVNPDVDAKTHAKISTGKKENKFGIDWDHVRDAYARAASLPGVEPLGLAVHIGSQLNDLAPFRAAFAKVAEMVAALRADGHVVSRLDLGGGLGVSYRGDTPPDLAGYAQLVRETVGGLGCHLAFEPGRWMVADAGVLVARTIYVKDGTTRRFLILDAAMNDLIRPALYEAYHEIRPVRQASADAPTAPVDVVGPVCESGDTFAVGRPMPPVNAGDLVALMNAGAYGAVMASTYNARPLVAEVMVRGDRFAVVRPRQTLSELIAADRLPPWIEAPPTAGAD